MAVKSIIMLVIYLGLMFLLKLDFNEDIIKLVKISLNEVKMIPKTIHYVWVGHNPKSKIIQECIATWKRICLI